MPVLIGARVARRNLIDYLEHGYSIDAFVDESPSVPPQQVVAALEAANEALVADAPVTG